jgi:hypothetical protein
MSECRDENCPSHQRFLEADTVRLLYKNRLQEVGKNLELLRLNIDLPLSPIAIPLLERTQTEIENCLLAAKLSHNGLRGNKEAADAKQG